MFPTVLGNLSILLAMTYYEPALQPFLLKEVICFCIDYNTFVNRDIEIEVSKAKEQGAIMALTRQW